ncbi:MAG: hypothetical protein EPO68_08760 [Planctomycetota bacterium]|nr:MAG: hypothetical protein EPO68_08760 [Planctomycetota bacterium]
MHQLSLHRSLGRSRSNRSALASLAAGALLMAPALAQNPFTGALWVSTDLDLPPIGGLALQDDANVLRIQGGASPRTIAGPGHWQAALGAVPQDIDALAFRPGIAADRYDAAAFSLTIGELGVLDGDVVALDGHGKLQVLVAESTFVLALGAPGANIDVDALAYDDAGNLYFSLEADLTSAVLGAVKDGDVLRMDGAGIITLHKTEADVQAAMTIATGLTTAISDVSSLEWAAGELWVSTIGPSSVDGSVLVLGAAPHLLAAEADFGIGGAEIDALALVPAAAENAVLNFDFASSVPGGTIQGRIEGGAPLAPVMVVCAGNAGALDLGGFGGFGALLLDPADPWLVATLSGSGPSIGKLDAQGGLSVGFSLPPGLTGGIGFAGESGWSFQAIELAPVRVGAPARIKL